MNIPEEPTEENIQQLIDSLPPGLKPLERLILCHFGTVQTMLSIIYKKPVRVTVLSQQELGDMIIRWSRLTIDNDQTVCLAESIIPKNNPMGFRSAILERKWGIGQIIKACHLQTTREITGMFADDDIIARNYKIVGDVTVLITETFLRQELEDVP